MRRDKLLGLSVDLLENVYETLASKGRDYASEEDGLRQFKETAEAVGIDPLQVWQVFFLKQISAIQRYVRDGQVESEAVESRIIDAIAYLALLHSLIKERNEVQNHS